MLVHNLIISLMDLIYLNLEFKFKFWVSVKKGFYKIVHLKFVLIVKQVDFLNFLNCGVEIGERFINAL